MSMWLVVAGISTNMGLALGRMGVGTTRMGLGPSKLE